MANCNAGGDCPLNKASLRFKSTFVNIPLTSHETIAFSNDKHENTVIVQIAAQIMGQVNLAFL